MALTTYLTVNGTIFSQKKNGVRTHFIHDALGSVVATVNDGGSVVNKYTYKPYGELLSKTGVGEDPKFLWVGGAGYRTTGSRWAEKYVRRRHYGEQQGMWTTVDPLWPSENAYGYVTKNPGSDIDPTGLQQISQQFGKSIWGESRGSCCYWLKSGFDICGIGRIPGTCELKIKPDCFKAWQILSDCEQRFYPAALCDTFDKQDADCCGAAKAMGVDAKCLCAVLISERNYFNRAIVISCFTDRLRFGSTFGCTQLSVGTVNVALGTLSKCRPDLIRKLFPNYPYSDAQIANLLTNDCKWSTLVAAAYLKVNTDPKCTKGGMKGTCENWALKLWNPKNNNLLTMIKCARKAFGVQNPCT